MAELLYLKNLDNLHQAWIRVKDTLGNHGQLLNSGTKLWISAQPNALLRQPLFLISRYLELLWKLSCANVIKYVLSIYTVPSIN